MASFEVAVSATVGKQVFPTSGKNTYQVCVDGLTLTPSAANTTIKIRDGNASGEVVFFAKVMSAQGSRDFEFEHKFTKGMHVKILGTAGVAYLNLE